MAQILSQWREGPEDGWPSWAFSNHDVIRVATRWGEAIGAPTPRAATLFLSLLLSLRGTIFLYQGEELGLPEADVPFERLQDPWGVNGWPATKGRDGCRTPMPWKNAINGGFTRAKEPWLPIDPCHRALGVEEQNKLSESVLATARKLIALRQSSAALREGNFFVCEPAQLGKGYVLYPGGAPLAPEELEMMKNTRNAPPSLSEEEINARMESIRELREKPPDKSTPKTLRLKDEGVLVFARGGPTEALLCVFNFTALPVTREIDGIPSVLWASDAVLAGGSLMMEPFGSAILKLS
jgi:glycosidase